MKKIIFVFIATVCIVFAEGFTLKSNDISGQLSNNQVFNGFGCKGKNISPELSWENIPEGTKSFALTMYDKDAPTGSGWWHWVVLDIPKETNSLLKNSGNVDAGLMPKGAIQLRTDFGSFGFGGACPPEGDIAHQYIITIHALDVDKLGVNANATAALAGYMINAHTIGKTSVIGYYGR